MGGKFFGSVRRAAAGKPCENGRAAGKKLRPGWLSQREAPPKLQRHTLPAGPPPEYRNSIKQSACHFPGNGGAVLINTLLWLAFVGWLVTLFILSSIPGSRFGAMPFDNADKVAHILIFTTGAFLLASAFHRSLGRWLVTTMILVFVAMILIGASDEFHQIYTPGRSGNDRGDLTADAIGALIGILFARLLHGKRSSKPNLSTPSADSAA